LNGKKLAMIDDYTMPSITPDQEEFSSSIEIPPLTFGYWVFPDAYAKACIHKSI
jgi:heparanase 1